MEVPEIFIGGYLPEMRVYDQKNCDHFTVDDLLDFPNEEDVIMSDEFLANASKNSINGNDSSTFTSNDSCHSSGSAAGNVGYESFVDSHFSSELCAPYDDLILAELEWLSNFVEDSFSNDQNLQSNLHILSASKPVTPDDSPSEFHQEPMTRNPNNQNFHSETPLPAKARSKRSRVAPDDWSTRLLHLSPKAKTSSRKQENPNSEIASGSDVPVRKCLHCAAEKTPQWRTGPMGPKTLCNACGVRYKSGRLVPEYRPAASPTFVSSKHSNSHRKVLELRRQKEMQKAQKDQFPSQSPFLGVSNGEDDFLIHHHTGPNFRHMM